MHQNIKISIITVSYNSGKTIEDTIVSVLSQNYQNIEYIIVDGGSTDSTLTIINHYSEKLAKYISEPDAGLYDAMNKGIALATGDVIGFLNSDDVYASETVLTQVADVFMDNGVEACFSDLVYTAKDNLLQIRRFWKSKEYSSGLFERGWMPAHPTFFVRKCVYQRFGVFNLSFPRQADFELTLRFLNVFKIKSIYIPNVWIKMRLGGASNNSILWILKGGVESFKACKLHNLKTFPLPFFIAIKLISKVPQFFRSHK
jgi:glycosyltransferase involved in cell wall biosynthesis